MEATQFESYEFSENELNSLGYRLMAKKMAAAALEILKLNAEVYPQSANVYDSLGEAYLANGEVELAIRNYEKSLELDPRSSSAARQLRKLRSE